MRVDYSTRLGGLIGIFFSIFSNTKVCCVFSLESPHWSDSNEYKQPTIINMKKSPEISKYNDVCSYGIFVRDSRTGSK